jgi:hypothetical protein
MDSEERSAALCKAFDAMQQQIQSAHRQWVAELVGLFPHLADTLWQYHDHYCARHEFTEALPLLLTLNPDLSLADLVRRYSAEINASVTGEEQEVQESPVTGDALDSRQRAALTKRRRTREALITAAVEIIKEGGAFRGENIAEAAGVGLATLYNHFGSKGELLKVAYERLLTQLLGPKNDID